MRTWNSLLLTATLVAGPACAIDAPSNASVMSATGEGNWEIICHVSTGGGDDSLRILNGGKTSFSLAGMRSASCSFHKPSAKPLTITFESATLLCPFKSVAAPDACRQTFEKGAVGSFDLKPKSGR